MNERLHSSRGDVRPPNNAWTNKSINVISEGLSLPVELGLLLSNRSCELWEYHFSKLRHREPSAWELPNVPLCHAVADSESCSIHARQKWFAGCTANSVPGSLGRIRTQALSLTPAGSYMWSNISLQFAFPSLQWLMALSIFLCGFSPFFTFLIIMAMRCLFIPFSHF